MCDGYLSTVFLVEGKLFCVAKLLKEYKEDLSEYGFLRVNYNTLLNPKHISDIEPIENGRKSIKVGKEEIIVSRSVPFSRFINISLIFLYLVNKVFYPAQQQLTLNMQSYSKTNGNVLPFFDY